MNDDRTGGLGGPEFRTGDLGARPRPTDFVTTEVLPEVKRVSWGAIAAGVSVALVSQIALALAGLAVGLGQVNPASEAGWAEGLGTGAAVWLALSTIVSLFFGGLCAGRLSGLPRRPDSALHGLVTWAVVTLFGFWFLTSAVGGLAGGAAGLVGDVVTGGAGVAEQVTGELRGLAPEAGKVDPAEAEAFAGRAGQAASWGFLALLFGAGAAALGGYLGRSREVATPMIVRPDVH